MATTQIRSAQILDGSIVAADLASNSVTTVKILDGNVTVAKLSDFRASAGAGLTLNFAAGRLRSDNVITDVSAGSLSLTDDETNYVEVDDTGTVSFNTVGFTAGSLAIAIATTVSGAITAVADKRAWFEINPSDVAGELTNDNFVDNETPGGDLDGMDVTYALADAPSPVASLHLYMNGLRLSEGGSNDYTLSGSTITFTSAPISTDVILADYRV